MRRAFTLIEVMVVLSILALLAILAYNYFGSTIKESRVSEAATQIYKDMTTIEAAYHLAAIKTGSFIEPSSPDVTYVKNIASLMDDGGLKAIPSPPLSGFSSLSTNVWNYEYGLLSTSINDFGGPTTAKEVAVYLPDINADVCLKLNERYSSVGATIPTGYQANVGFACIAGGNPDNMQAYMVPRYK